MSKEYVEDLIDSISNKKEPMYLRKGWLITARSRLDQLDKELKVLEKCFKKEERSSK